MAEKHVRKRWRYEVILFMAAWLLSPAYSPAADDPDSADPVVAEDMLIEDFSSDLSADVAPAPDAGAVITGDLSPTAADDLEALVGASGLAELEPPAQFPAAGNDVPELSVSGPADIDALLDISDEAAQSPLADLTFETESAASVAAPNDVDAILAEAVTLESLSVETVADPVAMPDADEAAAAEQPLATLDVTQLPDALPAEDQIPSPDGAVEALPAMDAGIGGLVVEGPQPDAAGAAAVIEEAALVETGFPAALTPEETTVEESLNEGLVPEAAVVNPEMAVDPDVGEELEAEALSQFGEAAPVAAEAVAVNPVLEFFEGTAASAPAAEETILEELTPVAGAVEEAEVAAEMVKPVTPDVLQDNGPKTSGPEMPAEAKDARWLSEGEALRRQAFLQHAQEMLAAADQAFEKQDYLEAWTLYEKARKSYEEVGDVADAKPARERIKSSITESKYRRALTLIRYGDLEEAIKLASDAGHEGHLKAVSLVEQIKIMMQERPTPAKPERARWMQEDYLAKSRDLRNRMREGREFFMAGEYEEAQKAFESVLSRDPNNTEAMRWREKVSQKLYRSNSDELISTRADMMAMVRDTWNPRNYVDMDAQSARVPTQQTRETQVDRRRSEILAKLEKIMIPELNFRQANIHDVIEYLQQQSELYDPGDNRTGRKGVNIILHLGQAPAPQAVGVAEPAAGGADFDFFGGGGGAAAPAAGGGGERLITMRASDISLGQALKIVAEYSGLKYRIEGNVVMVVPINARDGELIYQMYDVLPTVSDRISEFKNLLGGAGLGAGGGGNDFAPVEAGADAGAGGDTDWKGFFEQMGVRWPEGSSIKLIAPIGKLMVANTAENLSIFEQRLAALNVVPSQIEIETRFVEIKQTDLNSLGLEFLLTDPWDIAIKQGRTYGTSERIVMPETSFTKGNRYLSPAGSSLTGISGADDILSIASVLTNPELKIVLRAIEQKGNSDLLSAPKITTQSGMEATIRVVTEYIYPANYTIEPGTLPIYDGSQLVTPGQPPVVSPDSWQTREVGVILAVLPEVSPEGQLINLTMTPEVVTEPTWRNYGQTFEDGLGNVTTVPIEQPFFNTRSISTSIMIYDGATVVMGGMITEARVEVNDKIPLLGDLPLIGRLFQSRYEQSEKRNLLIFVTARLVDPAGRSIRQSEQRMADVLQEQDRLARQAVPPPGGAAPAPSPAPEAAP